MNNTIKIIALFLIAFSFYTCDEIENPLKEQDETTCGDDSSPIPIKKILVADYTGQKCVNCPAAAEVLHQIKRDYCDHVIPISIHVSGFAAPNTSFPADYRTEAGNELDAFYGVSNQGLPNGIVSRKAFNGNIVIGKDDWRSAVHAIHKSVPEAQISIITSYNPSTKTLDADVTITILQNLNYELNLGIYITEDSIVSPQITPEGTVENYVHRHVLRKAVNGAFGESFKSSAMRNDVFEKHISISLDPEWKAEHCEMIVFLSNSASKEILQVENEALEE